MTFLQQGRDTDFFENYNHCGKRVVAKLCQIRRGQVRLDLEEKHQCVIVKSLLQLRKDNLVPAAEQFL